MKPRKSGRATVLVKRHQELVADGFLPIEVEIEGLVSDKIQCWICKYPDLVGYLVWKNAKTGEVRYTGLTCFERVADRITLDETDKFLLRWAATHRDKIKERTDLKQIEIIRKLSYKNPLSRIYGGDWKTVAKLLWGDFESQPDSYERRFLETLVFERGKYWVPSSPTPKQRRFLNEILLKYLRWKYVRD